MSYIFVPLRTVKHNLGTNLMVDWFISSALFIVWKGILVEVNKCNANKVLWNLLCGQSLYDNF